MIDANRVEERGGAPAPSPEPSEVSARHRLPARHRQAPPLSLGVERVRRSAELRVELKLFLTGPHIRALAANHERQITGEGHASSACGAPGRCPLLAGEPLHVRMEAEVAVERLAGMRQHLWRPRAERGLPLRPGGTCLAFLTRAEERVVGEPVRLGGSELPEARGPRRPGAPLAQVEAGKRDLQRAPLHGAHAIVVDPRLDASRIERRALRTREHGLSARLEEVLDLAEREVDGIDGEGGERPVGAPLACRHLEDREELQEAVPGRAEPLAVGRQIPDLADPPVPFAAEGKERHEEARRAGRDRVHARACA